MIRSGAREEGRVAVFRSRSPSTHLLVRHVMEISVFACVMARSPLPCKAQSPDAVATARHELESSRIPSDPSHCSRATITVTGAEYDTHACRNKIGDTLVYTYRDVTNDRTLVATLWVRFATAELPAKADSIQRELTRQYGVGRECGPDSWRRTFVSRYLQWRVGDYTVRLQVDTLSHASPVHSTVTVQVVDGLVSCDAWFGPPFLEPRR